METSATVHVAAISGIKCFARVFLISVAGLASGEMANASDSSYNFVKLFEQAASSRENYQIPHRLGIDSPWHPYLGFPFVVGLNDKERAHLEADIQNLNCKAVVTWEQQGFVGLYPQIDAIFLDSEVASDFTTSVLPRHSFAFRRCISLQRIVKTLEAEQRNRPDEPDLSLWANPADITVNPNRMANSKNHELVAAVSVFGDLLLCHEQPAVFGDLLRLADRFKVDFVVFDTLARYLTLRVRELGVAVADDNPIYRATLNEHGLPPEQLLVSRIEYHMKMGDLISAQKLLPFDFDNCSKRVPVMRGRG